MRTNGLRRLPSPAFFALVLLTLASCAPVAAEPARTWEKAWVWIPRGGDIDGVIGRMGDANMHEVISQVASGTQIATVIYMHGCAGFGSDAQGWASTLRGAGYAVIQPNSFAREHRPPGCEYAGAPLDVLDLRQEEIEYTITQVRKLDWVDQGNVFLMGFSEGGIATARYLDRARYLKGYIITGWTCTSLDYPHLERIGAPFNTPVLSIVFEDESWFRNPWTAGNCEGKFAGRKDAKSLVLEGTGHSTAYDPEAKEAVLRFLKENTIKRP